MLMAMKISTNPATQRSATAGILSERTLFVHHLLVPVTEGGSKWIQEVTGRSKDRKSNNKRVITTSWILDIGISKLDELEMTV